MFICTSLLNSSADNEPTKDWIRIGVSALHGKVECHRNESSVMVPCDNRDVERAQPIGDLAACNGFDRLTFESFAESRQVRSKIV
jgi:hypothetical protein